MTTVFYKGAGPGTHWHRTDARLVGGFQAVTPSGHTHSLVVRHIALALSRKSNYLSFSTSYDVARRYALDGPYGQASASMPGYVYEIDLAQITGQTQSVVDPIAYIASGSNGSYAHEHDGSASLLLEVAQGLTSYTPAKHCGGSLLAPAVSLEFRAMVNAIRDAEILLMHSVPAGATVDRHDEF